MKMPCKSTLGRRAALTSLPLFGTTLGAGCVFFLKRQIHPLVQKALLGFASGVMVAAAVWSLLIPAMDQSAHLGRLAFLPAAVGFLLGMAFLLLMDQLVPHLHLGSGKERRAQTAASSG